MKITLLIMLALSFHTYSIFSLLTFKLEVANEPTQEQLAAYTAIHKAMTLAVHRYNQFVKVDKTLTVSYHPEIALPPDIYVGSDEIKFGSRSGFWTEHVALHTISHHMGVGGPIFLYKCKHNAWNLATIKARSIFKDPKLELTCDEHHFWPGGLNKAGEFSPTNADNHCKIIQAMRDDGMV